MSDIISTDRGPDPGPWAIKVLSSIPPERIACQLTILVDKHSRTVELSVQPAELLDRGGLGREVLELGLRRLLEMHRGKRESGIILPS